MELFKELGEALKPESLLSKSLQIKTILGRLLFEHEKEDNSILKTLVNAVGQDANLQGADLRGANLQGADLQGANLPIYCKYNISIVDDKIKIGCKTKSIKGWNDIFKRSEFQGENKGNIEAERIHANYKAVKAYYFHMKKLK